MLTGLGIGNRYGQVHKIVGSDFEPPQAAPEGEGQAICSCKIRTSVIPGVGGVNPPLNIASPVKIYSKPACRPHSPSTAFACKNYPNLRSVSVVSDIAAMRLFWDQGRNLNDFCVGNCLCRYFFLSDECLTRFTLFEILWNPRLMRISKLINYLRLFRCAAPNRTAL